MMGPLEKFINQLVMMDREEVIGLLKTMHCTFPVDFTDEFLQVVSLDRLRHLALAASVHREGKACA